MLVQKATFTSSAFCRIYPLASATRQLADRPTISAATLIDRSIRVVKISLMCALIGVSSCEQAGGLNDTQGMTQWPCGAQYITWGGLLSGIFKTST